MIKRRKHKQYDGKEENKKREKDQYCISRIKERKQHKQNMPENENNLYKYIDTSMVKKTKKDMLKNIGERKQTGN